MVVIQPPKQVAWSLSASAVNLKTAVLMLR